ncbi:DUF4226 domain-containing protein [Mycolicibacter longobardus]|uniref:DUF4226 domain-containing protein n=1 Tax=Mycolicibacter longobardus TaxID=1108812 RepID=A0A1X1YCN9_9MYCO|nr:DUF4226 domain-containing protein [Mycolicibacter longobardus]MCV7386351.1 DUF4226 domain-containing protein [Mycolicibacter longobardus]ORW08806.1 hypothetical protein AWC16_18465 [Mycolicibacter longobardus]
MPEELGAHGDAARAREDALARRLQSSAQADRAFVATVRGAAQAAVLGRKRLDSIEAEIHQALANHRALALNTPAGVRQFQRFLTAKTRDIHQVVADTVADSRARAQVVRSLSGGYAVEDPRKPGVQAVDHVTYKQAPSTDDERRLNQIDAFKQVFGRDPVSASDWTTAAALDAHTYDPKFQGVNSEVRVARIDPVPGQGVVRASQWIPQRDVSSVPPWKRDFGNERGPNAHFDPEDTKVTTYIDYDNGIVVMRQNPSVELNPSGGPGQVKVGVPQGGIAQAPDGSVRIKYDAGNPFAPGALTDVRGPFGDHRWSVNGDLVFTPGPGGVHVDGTRTDYPSLEVYQDLPNGSTRTVLIDPAQSGSSTGPMFNLPFHHDVGVGGKAFAPFDHGGDWNPPLPVTAFGPTAAPPSVPSSSGRPGGVPA